MFCAKKTSRPLSQLLKDAILRLVQNDVDFFDTRRPSGICVRCRVLLQQADKGEISPSKIPPLFDVRNVKVTKALRDKICDCRLCEIGRENVKTRPDLKKGMKAKKGGRPTQKEMSFSGKPPTPIKTCPRCFSRLLPGLRHQCTEGVRREFTCIC